MKKALITKLIGGRYTLVDLSTKEEIVAVASGKLRHVMVDESSVFSKQITRKTKIEPKRIQVSPKVGDHIYYNDSEDQVVIEQILPRKNELVRPDLANLDQVLLVFSVVEPTFSFNLLDKFLINLFKNNIPATILVSKIDLASDQVLMDLKKDLRYYESMGISISYVNSFSYDTKVISPIFDNKVTALAGQTGVGKSTLLNSLIPQLELKTQEISKALGRGKHTTRHVELFKFGNGYIADTAGFSKFDFTGIFYFDELKNYYPDFISLSENCQFLNKCNHINEPKCEVKKQVTLNHILKSRYDNYLLFTEEIKKQKERY